MKSHVVKIGGSLLRATKAPERLREWLAGQANIKPHTHQIIIVGGGEAVDGLRRIDMQSLLHHDDAHWAAIMMMDANTQAIAHWLPSAELTNSWSMVKDRMKSPGATWFQTADFLRHQEPNHSGRTLPIGWEVTSDSIAARVAVLLNARLTLLKSRTVENPCNNKQWQQLAAEGIIDPFFPQIVNDVPHVECVSLAGEEA